VFWFDLFVGTFACVTRTATCGAVFKRALTAVTDWQHMVKGAVTFVQMISAVLADKTVSQKYIAFGESNCVLWLHVFGQHNDTGYTSFPFG
jgi:hypothetical protein